MVFLSIKALQIALEQAEERPMKALRLDDRPWSQPVDRQADSGQGIPAPPASTEPFHAPEFVEAEFTGDPQTASDPMIEPPVYQASSSKAKSPILMNEPPYVTLMLKAWSVPCAPI
jgi:hypothetical protein